jgi:WD40 repeat protein
MKPRTVSQIKRLTLSVSLSRAILQLVAALAPSLVCLSPQAQIAPGSPANQGHHGYVTTVAFSDDSVYLATAGRDGTIKIWKTATGELIKTVALTTRIPITEICFRPGTTQLAYVDGVQIKLVDAPSGAVVTAWNWDANLVHISGITTLQFSKDGSALLTGYSDGAAALWRPKSIHLLAGADPIVSWDIAQTYNPKHTSCIARLSPDMLSVATAPFFGGEMKIIATDKPLDSQAMSFADNPCLDLQFAPNGKQVLHISRAQAALVDISQMKVVATVPLTEGHYAAFSPTAPEIAVTDKNNVSILDLASFRTIRTLFGHKDRVFAVAYSRDGRWIATGSRDYTAAIWDAHTGAQLHLLGAPATLTSDQLKAPKD